MKPCLLKGNSLFSSKATFIDLVGINSFKFVITLKKKKQKQTILTFRKKNTKRIFYYLPNISFDLLLEDNVVDMFSQDSLYLFLCVGFKCIWIKRGFNLCLFCEIRLYKTKYDCSS